MFLAIFFQSKFLDRFDFNFIPNYIENDWNYKIIWLDFDSKKALKLKKS